MNQPDLFSDDALTTAVEAEELARCETVIARGLKTFIEVGEALTTIRDSRLYRQSHPTFDAYCQERWGWTAGRARQLIGAAETATNVAIAGGTAPATESQARELAGLSPDDAAEVMRLARQQTGGKVTAAAIASARQAVTAPCYPYRVHPLTAELPWDQRVVDAIAEKLDRDRDPANPGQLVAGSVSQWLRDHFAIVLSADGTTIVDGRLRYAAYRKAGIEPRFRRWPHATSIWTAPSGDEIHVINFIIGMNLCRHHLSGDQRAIVAVGLPCDIEVAE